jgi:hypothetical protein
VRLIAFHPAAAAEVLEAARFYEMRSPGLGADLLTEVERALGQIAASPEASPRVGRRTRRKLLWRFPYSLLFAADQDRLRVVALAHHKRRPFYWMKRLAEEGEDR